MSGYYAPGDEFRVAVAGCWFSLDIRCGCWSAAIGYRVKPEPAAGPAELPVRVVLKWHVTKRVPKLGRIVLIRTLCKRKGRLRTWAW